MDSDGMRTVADLVASLERSFPSAWAEEWDRVGLIAGDPIAEIAGILVTLDATAEAVRRACDAGANVLVTHHPPFLDPPDTVGPAPGPAGTLHASVDAKAAVISLHTNLDRSPAGADALSLALGFPIAGSLESSMERVTALVTYAPVEVVPTLRSAMASAGAGRIGRYEECVFESPGTGRFSALEGAHPFIAQSGAGVAETRIEMVAPPALAQGVAEAIRSAHPYEEPVILALEGMRLRGAARLGRVCEPPGDQTARGVAQRAHERLGVVPRIWGDPDKPARRIAVANGSAGSLIGDALSVADVLVAGEVRYHDALDAVARGLTIVEIGHDASEWPIVNVLATAVREWTGSGIPVTLEDPRPVWQTLEVADDRG